MSVPITVRKFEFSPDAENDFYWHPAGPAVTIFIYCLSLAFPEAERFLIDTVRENRDGISDPKLLKDVSGFIGQEGYHSKQHERYNDLMISQKINLGRINRLASFVADLGRWFLTRRVRLGVTAAIEHFTAIIADEVLKNPLYFAGAPANHTALWKWHAVEETEHKAVSFDVFHAVGGNYWIRALTMLGTTFGFVFGLFFLWLVLMFQTGDAWKFVNWRTAYRWLFRSPGLVRNLLPAYKDYYRRGFHPWQQNNLELIDAWRREYAPQELNAPAA